MNKSLIAISGKIGSGKDTVAKIIQYLTWVKGGEATYEDFCVIYKEMENNYAQIASKVLSGWENKKFAGKLKQIVSILTGIPVADLEREEVKNQLLPNNWNYWINSRVTDGKRFNTEAEVIAFYLGAKPELRSMTVRQLLQEMGTDAMRNIIHPNIHINALFADYKMIGCGRIEICETPNGDCDSPKCHSNWIISDIRFPNEIEAVKKRGGITIRIERFKEGDEVYWSDPDTTEFPEGASSGVYTIAKTYPEHCLLKNDVGSESEVPYDEIKHYRPNEHYSENALDNATFDYKIYNVEGIEELIEKTKDILIEEGIL